MAATSKKTRAKLKITYRPIEELVPYEKNAKQHPDWQLAQIAKSIAVNEFNDPIGLASDTMEIIEGHGRMEAVLKFPQLREKFPDLLKDMPDLVKVYKELPTIDLKHLNLNERKAYRIAHNRLSMNTGFDETVLIEELDLLIEDGVSLEGMGFTYEEYYEMNDRVDGPPGEPGEGGRGKHERVTVEMTDSLDTEKILETLDKFDKIFISYSGGKDSTTMLYLLTPFLEGRDVTICFVQCGYEFPDLGSYIIDTCKKLGWIENLRFLPPVNDFLLHYDKKGRMPNFFFRDCLHTIIYSAMDAYTFTFADEIPYEKHLMIGGSRAGQKLATSTSKELYTVKVGKRYKTIFNPLYSLSDEAFEEKKKEVDKRIGLWPGYKLGFKRTACWTCPFQTVQQYKALKKHYPIMWEVLKQKAKEWNVYPDCTLAKMIRKDDEGKWEELDESFDVDYAEVARAAGEEEGDSDYVVK